MQIEINVPMSVTFECRSIFRCPVDKLFQFHEEKVGFKTFRHEHRFISIGDYSELNDHIEFEFFLNPISKYFVAQKLKSQFRARHEAAANYLQVGYETKYCGLI